MKPEAQARQQIHALLTQAGWVVQEFDHFNLGAARGVAIAEFPLSTGPPIIFLSWTARPSA